jgi:hypothetical protein
MTLLATIYGTSTTTRCRARRPWQGWGEAGFAMRWRADFVVCVLWVGGITALGRERLCNRWSSNKTLCMNFFANPTNVALFLRLSRSRMRRLH